MIRQLRKIYLLVYQSIGIVALFSISAVIFIFFSLMLFFMFNSNWIAPTVLSATSDRMLAFQASLITETQAKGLIDIQHLAAQKQLITLNQQLLDLSKFSDQLNSAIHNEISTDGKFVGSKRQQLTRNKSLLSSIQKDADKSLAAGLITRSEATQEQVALAQFNSLALDAEMTTDTLSRQQATLTGIPQAIDTMAALRQRVDLDTQINTTKDNIAIQERTIVETEQALARANIIMNTLNDTVYMSVLNNEGGNFAFVEYQNLSGVKVGSPVYDCYAVIALCHQVATVKKIYHDEQVVDFPIFNVRFSRTVRGTVILLDVTDPSAMHSTILFYGYKPLLF